MPRQTDKRDLILRAAAPCFARYGYAKTTLDDIGRAVGLNKASLYYYYPGKDELFMAVVLRESAFFQEELAARVMAPALPADRIRRYLLERLAYYRQVLHQHQLSLENLHTLEPRFDALYAQVRDKEVAFLTTLLPPLPTPADGPRVAALLLTVADAIKHDAVRAAGGLMATEVDFTVAEADISLLVGLLLAGLSAQPVG